jgi:hypothetical protein
MGTFEFRVCSIDDDPAKDATQNCLDLNVLKLEDGITQYKIERSFTTIHLNITLPSELVCKHCVFQWKYKTGNSWGSSNGKSCLGCGRVNEEFYGCADIAILSEDEALAIPTTTTTTASPSVILPNELTLPPRNCTSAIIFSQTFDISAIMDQYCQTVCPDNCALDKITGNEILYNGCVNSCNVLCVCQ